MTRCYGFEKLGAGPGLVGSPLHGSGKSISPKFIGDDGYDHADAGLNVVRVLVVAVGAK